MYYSKSPTYFSVKSLRNASVTGVIYLSAFCSGIYVINFLTYFSSELNTNTLIQTP